MEINKNWIPIEKEQPERNKPVLVEWINKDGICEHTVSVFVGMDWSLDGENYLFIHIYGQNFLRGNPVRWRRLSEPIEQSLTSK